jgi:hypothetical protein
MSRLTFIGRLRAVGRRVVENLDSLSGSRVSQIRFLAYWKGRGRRAPEGLWAARHQHEPARSTAYGNSAPNALQHDIRSSRPGARGELTGRGSNTGRKNT